MRVDGLGDFVDQLDDQLCHVVAGSGLAPKHDQARLAVLQVQDSLFDLDPSMHHLQDIHQLPLVLVDSLHLNVKQGIRIDLSNLRASLINEVG